MADSDPPFTVFYVAAAFDQMRQPVQTACRRMEHALAPLPLVFASLTTGEPDTSSGIRPATALRSLLGGHGLGLGSWRMIDKAYSCLPTCKGRLSTANRTQPVCLVSCARRAGVAPGETYCLGDALQAQGFVAAMLTMAPEQ